MEKRDDLRDEVAQEVHDLAQANLAALTDYGTTAATLSALQTRIDVYTLAVPSTRAARTNVSTMTQLLEQELRRVDMIQRDRLDALMEQFSDTKPVVYSDYKNARKLVDNAGGSGSGTTPPPPAPPTP